MQDFFYSLVDGIYSMFFPSGEILDITKFLVYSGALMLIFGVVRYLSRGCRS